MNTSPFRRFAMVASLFCAFSTSGCNSKTVTYDSPQNGFVMPYPVKGQNVSADVETILNRLFDPRLSLNLLTGPIQFQISDAKVIAVDALTPRPDYYEDNFIVSLHMKISFPNGQTLEMDGLEKFVGKWKEGEFANVSLGYLSESPWAWMDGYDDIQTPEILTRVQKMVVPPVDQDGLNDVCSVGLLLKAFADKDITKGQIELKWLLQAHNFAMQHNSILPSPSSVKVDQDTATNASTASQPVPTPTPPIPAPVAPPVVPSQPTAPLGGSQNTEGDYVDIVVTPGEGGTFHIPIENNQWKSVKDALPKFAFDSAAWAQILGSMSHVQAEQKLYDNMLESYHRGQKQTAAANGPMISQMIQAEVIAKQPGATWQQIRTYEAMEATDNPKLDSSTRYLVAVKIVLESIKADIQAQSVTGQ